jgi:CheY-like chemotaxis protein
MLAQSVYRRHIVLVEDDETLEQHVVAVLRHSFPEVDVRRTRDPNEALRWLKSERCDLLITDAQAGNFDGVALATSARAQCPGLAVIVIGTVEGESWRRRVSALGAVAWLPRPPRIEQLVGLVGRVLVIPVGFTGELEVSGLPDLVQLLCMTSATGALHVEHGDERGSIWLDRGAVVDALAGGVRGIRSFQRMLAWEGGLFAFDRNGRASARSIELPTMQLLLESVRSIDEARVDLQRAPRVAGDEERRSSEVRLRVVGGEASKPKNAPPPKAVAANGNAAPFGQEQARTWATPQQHAAECAQRGMELVQQKQYAQALLEWEKAALLDPGNKTIAANLRRLRVLAQRHDKP